MRPPDTETEILTLCRKLGRPAPETEKAIYIVRNYPQESQSLLQYYRFQAEAKGIKTVNLNSFDDPPPEFLDGSGCRIGEALSGNEPLGTLTLPPSLLTDNHILLNGETGSGKSGEVVNIVLELAKHFPDRVVVIFDSENEFGGMLANYLGPDKLVVMHYLDYWKTLFQPIEFFGKGWTDQISTMLYNHVFIGDSGKLLFTQEANKLTSKKIVAAKGYPTYGEIVRQIDGMKVTSKQVQYKETLRTRIRGMAGSLGQIYNHRRGFTWFDFSGKILCLNLFGLDALARALFIAFELSEILFFATANPWFKVTAVFDELQRFASRGTNSHYPTPVEEVAMTGRKRDFRLICSQTTMWNIKPEILDNMGAAFFFKSKTEPNRRATSYFSNLNRDQQDELATLPNRNCVFSCPEFDYPVLIKTPELNLEKHPQEALEMSRPFVEEHHKRFSEKVIVTGGDITEEIEPEEKAEDAHIRCLRIVAMNPFLKQKDYFEKWGLGTGNCQRIKKELLKMGFIEEHKLNPGGKGGTFMTLSVTDKGKSLVKADIPKIRGKGDFDHVCFQHMVDRHLTSLGVNIVVEGSINGKNVDLKEYSDTGVIAWEIEMKVTSQTLKNIQDDLRMGADSVVVLVRTKSDLDQVKRLAKENGVSPLVRVGLLHEFLGGPDG